MQKSTLPLPRPVLRHLLESQEIGIGSRVLEVGCGRGELVAFLDHLGIDVTGLDESTEDLTLAREAAPRVDLYCGPIESWLPFDDGRFDMVLIRQAAAYEGNLTSSKCLTGTANLLRYLRPGGALTFLRRSEYGVPGHEVACYARHLSHFPGTCRVSHLPTSLTSWEACRWMLGLPMREAFQTITLQLPPGRGWINELDERFHETSNSRGATCCDWARQEANAHRAA
jgi:SAM-dependent methyltransferase